MRKNDNFSNFLNSKVSLICLNIILTLHINLCAGFPRKIESWLDDVQPVQGVCVAPSKPCDFNSIFYSFDGSCNNPNYPSAGQATTPLARILPGLYSDGYYQDRLAGDGQPLPLARVIQTTLLPNGFKPTQYINILFEGFGQFITHDTTRTRVDFSDPQFQCCVNNAPVDPLPDKCRPLIIPPDDPFYSQFGVTCVPGRRLISTKTLDCGAKPVLMINDQSAWMDLSFVYSPDEEMAQELRAPEGGLLKVKNDAETSNQNLPTITTGNKNCPLGGITFQPGGDCLFGGDFRLNQNIELLVPDVLFLNFHNFLANALKDINKQWQNDDLYFNARRIATAAYQHIVSNEYIILLIGPLVSTFYGLLPGRGSYVNCYNAKLNPQTFHSFASAASRVSHSTINGVFEYAGPQGEPQQYKLREKIFNNQFLFQKNAFLNVVEALTTQSCDTQDQFFSEEVAEHLFETAGSGFGNSLPAVDINRSRENGLQGYNAFRVLCGHTKLVRWEEFYFIVTRPEDVEKLRALYKGIIDDVDLYVVLAMEKPVHGTLGEVGACIVGAQFHQYKCADRLWYESESAQFSIEQLNSIRSITLSSIICSAMPEIGEVRRSSLLVESPDNPVISCNQTPQIDLNLWRVP